jgi:Tfp pilus assembly protein PilE
MYRNETLRVAYQNRILEWGNSGFTVVELMIMMGIIAILAVMTLDMSSYYLIRSRDSERSADMTIISHKLERYYRINADVHGLSYPPSTTTASEMATIIDDEEATKAPRSDSSGLVVATTSGAQEPTVDQYIYQARNLDGSICDTLPCVRYTLYYRSEITGEVKTIESLRQQ